MGKSLQSHLLFTRQSSLWYRRRSLGCSKRPVTFSHMVFVGAEFPLLLHLTFGRESCQAKYFKDGLQICGDPVYSHGFGWHLAAAFVPARDGSRDAGRVRIGIVMLLHPYATAPLFQSVQCAGARRIGDDGHELPIEMSIVYSGTKKQFHELETLPLRVCISGSTSKWSQLKDISGEISVTLTVCAQQENERNAEQACQERRPGKRWLK